MNTCCLFLQRRDKIKINKMVIMRGKVNKVERHGQESSVPKCIFLYSLAFKKIFFLFSLQPYLWHMEVPGPGVELELQLPTYTTATTPPDLSHICDLCCGWQQPTEPGEGSRHTSSGMLHHSLNPAEPQRKLLFLTFEPLYAFYIMQE